MKEYFFIVDGNSFMHRAFNGLPPLKNKNGFPTNAITGTTNMINSLIKKFDPKNIVVAFDIGRKNFRHDIYADYKANRPSMDDDLRQQFPIVKKIIDLWGIKRLEIGGVEADDSMASLAKKASLAGYVAVIVTSDKDLKQIVSDNILMLDTKEADKNPTPYGREGVFQREGVYPENIIDKLSLMGDVSDNIPGIAGIGTKTAVRLLTDYGSGEDIFLNLDKEKGALKEKLLQGEDLFNLSKELVTINQNLDLPDLDSYFKTDLIKEEMAVVLYEYGLKTLIKSLSLEEELEKLKINLKVPLVNINSDNIKECFLELDNEEDIYIYNEIKNNEELTYISTNYKKVYLLKETSLFDNKEALNYITEFSKQNRDIVLYGAKSFIKKSKLKGLEFDNLKDLSIVNYIINGGGIKKDLTLIELYENFCKSSITFNNTEEYNIAIMEIYKKQKEIIDNDIKLKKFIDDEMELLKIISIMEKKGISVSKDILSNVGEDLDNIVAGIKKEIIDLSGVDDININSPKQVSNLLFDVLGLVTKKKSTSEPVLKTLTIQHPVVQKILDYRSLSKIRSTYVTGLMKHITDKGRIHTTYNQSITNTGRLSSSDPNLQNIPIRSEEGRKIRNSFVSAQKKKFVSIDYSQIELRVLAHISFEEKLIYAFNNGTDIHKLTASEIFDVKVDEVTEKQRKIAKGINFGLIYGMSANSLAEDLDITAKEANSYKKMYFSKYSKIKPFMENELKTVKENLYTETLSGRKIYIDNINSKDGFIRSAAERSANNASIQGTAADIIKRAMIDTFNYIKENNIESDLLLQIHDELIFEINEDLAEDFAINISKVMENAFSLCVPLSVEYKISDHL